MPNPNPVVGRCFACGNPVRKYGAVYVSDPSVKLSGTNRSVRRVVHPGECRDRVQVMFVGKVKNA